MRMAASQSGELPASMILKPGRPKLFLRGPCWTPAPGTPMSYGQIAKERFMRPITGFVVAALAVLSLAGCSTTAANNTTYARPAASSGLQIPLN